MAKQLNIPKTSGKGILTERMKTFVKYWAQGDSIRNASDRAGYKDKGGQAFSVLVKRPEILALYDKEKKAYEAAAQMTRQKVMDGLLEAVEMAKLMAEPATMVSGWREIGKMCGYYEPTRHTVDVNVQGNIVMQRLDKLSDAELLKLIQSSGSEETSDGDDEGEGMARVGRNLARSQTTDG